MENKSKFIAIVKSPAKDAHLREGNGFSLKEIKESGKTTNLLNQLNIKIDYFRKSSYKKNIEKLKLIEEPKKKRKKRDPFVKKEKKKTPFKPEVEKAKIKRPVKPKPIKKEKVKKEKITIEAKGTPLTKLSGLGTTTAKKFVEIGVNNLEELCKENAKELALLISGVSEKRLKRWINDAKELIK